MTGKNLTVTVASRDAFDVRVFAIDERISSLFQIQLTVVSSEPSIDFDELVGQDARFSLHSGTCSRFWHGVVNDFQLVRAEPNGLSTYEMSIVPVLWLLSQRTNHRMFQHKSDLDIVRTILLEWGITPDVRVDPTQYPMLEYRVQYGESDFAFASRILEESGVAYWFDETNDDTQLVLCDAPNANPRRQESLQFLDDVSTAHTRDHGYATNVRLGQLMSHGRWTVHERDFRSSPRFPLSSSASEGLPVEARLEHFEYTPGAFPGWEERAATRLADKRLRAARTHHKSCSFETNAHDTHPGCILNLSGHPHAALADDKSFLVVKSMLRGTVDGEWIHRCETRTTDLPFRPPESIPKPRTQGMESATVVGPAGEEIHTDEFGRVKVHFHWDRESKMDETSSTWIPVSQTWAGAGYGGIHIPRVGHEVLVDFLGANPDRPLVVGRMYTGLQQVPYPLPEHKTRSGFRSQSTGGGDGFNEILFDDAAGRELVNVQAERDMTTLVKRNAEFAVGKDYVKRIVENETKAVGANQSTTVGANRTSFVGYVDETTAGESVALQVRPVEDEMASKTRVFVSDKKIVLDTGAGATITLENDTITLSAAVIAVESTDETYVCGNNLVTVESPAGDVVIAGGPMVHINP